MFWLASSKFTATRNFNPLLLYEPHILSLETSFTVCRSFVRVPVSKWEESLCRDRDSFNSSSSRAISFAMLISFFMMTASQITGIRHRKVLDSDLLLSRLSRRWHSLPVPMQIIQGTSCYESACERASEHHIAYYNILHLIDYNSSHFDQSVTN